jgi:hypothetical protein
MKRLNTVNWFIPVLAGMILFQFPLSLAAKEIPPHPVTKLSDQEEVSTYSSFIEGYVNRNWNRENPSRDLYRVTLLTITNRERIEQLNGQFNYCWVMLELGREIHECVACFFQPDKPADPLTPFEFKGIFEVGTKLTI